MGEHVIELILVRHAKSDWVDPTIRGHERPLNARGLKNAPIMATRLANDGVTVDRIVSSSAARASATADAFGEVFGVDVGIDPGLYMSTAETLFRAGVEAGRSSGARTVMLVAHDPGISVLAGRLSDGVIDHMPTCSVARFTWTGGWDEAAAPAATWSRDTPR